MGKVETPNQPDTSPSVQKDDSVKERVHLFLIDQNVPVKARTISEALGIPRVTVSGRLSELKKENMVYQPKPLYWAIVKGYGACEFEPPLMQNVRVVGENIPVTQHEKFTISGSGTLVFPDGLKIDVELGVTNKRVNYVISAPWGIDHTAWSLCHGLVEQEILKRGYVCDDWWVTMCEFHFDHFGIKLEMFSGIEINIFDGVLLKLYNKEGFLREEVRISKRMAVDEVMLMLRNGILVNKQFTLTSEVLKKLYDIEDALKHNNRSVDHIVSEFIRFVTWMKKQFSSFS